MTVFGSTLFTLNETKTRPKLVAAHSSLAFPGFRSVATTVPARRSLPYCALVRSPGSYASKTRKGPHEAAPFSRRFPRAYGVRGHPLRFFAAATAGRYIRQTLRPCVAA